MRIKVRKGAFMPDRQHTRDAGLDIFAPNNDGGIYMVEPHSTLHVDTGVYVELPANTVGFIKARSSMFRAGIMTDGVIDECYRGSIGVMLYNSTDRPYYFNAGQRIAQLVIVPCVYTDLILTDILSNTDRGEDGFGSTGA